MNTQKQSGAPDRAPPQFQKESFFSVKSLTESLFDQNSITLKNFNTGIV
jgi:hypothetical protein